MQVIPAVDVLDGKVVRLLRGDYAAATEYGESPVDQLLAWGDAGAKLVHVVDLAGAKTGVPDRRLWESLAAVDVPFQLGGGIRDASTATQAASAGVGRVVMGTAAVWEPGVLAETVSAVGADHVVAALDVRNGRATGAGWLDAGKALPEVVVGVVDAGVRTVLVTGIARDGTMDGPDVEVLEVVRSLAPTLGLLGSGGVGSLDDLSHFARVGVAGAIVGRALYEGRFGYAEAVAHLSGEPGSWSA